MDEKLCRENLSSHLLFFDSFDLINISIDIGVDRQFENKTFDCFGKSPRNTDKTHVKGIYHKVTYLYVICKHVSCDDQDDQFFKC